MNPMHPSSADKRRAFRQLHEAGCFVIPNPWDTGSARMLQGLGFKALATTSSGFAWSRGHPDNGVTRDMALAHLRDMVAETDVPVNADFERGFAANAAGLAESVRLAIETGIAGLSIEDSTGDELHPLYPIDEACERLRAARLAIDQTGADVMLVGRAECFLVGRSDIAETIARLKAYAHAGADCLYAPGLWVGRCGRRPNAQRLLRCRSEEQDAVYRLAPPSARDDVPVHRRQPRQQLVLHREWNREFIHAGLQQLDLAEAVGLRDVQVGVRGFHRVAVIDARAGQQLAKLIAQLGLEPGKLGLLEVVADARVCPHLVDEHACELEQALLATEGAHQLGVGCESRHQRR